MTAEVTADTLYVLFGGKLNSNLARETVMEASPPHSMR